MSVLIVIASLVPILLLGDFARRLIAPQGFSAAERFVLALVLGSSVLAWLLFGFSLIDVPSAMTLTFCSMMLWMIVVYSRRIWLGWRPVLRLPAVPIFLAPIFLLWALAILVALNTDLGLDGWTNWGFKARIAFIEGGWAANYFTDPSFAFAHQDYPLLISSLEAWAYTFLGRIDEQAIKVLFPLFYLALLLMFYHATQKFRSVPLSMLYVVILGTTPFLSSIAAPSGLADVPLMLYIFSAVVFIHRWLLHGKPSDLLLGAVLSASSVWVKREGMVYWGVNLAAVMAWLSFARTLGWRERIRSLGIFLLPAAGILVPWLVFLNYRQVSPTDFAFAFSSIPWMRLPVIVGYMLQEFATLNLWGLLWLIFFFSILMRFRTASFSDLYVGASAFIPFGLLELSFVFSTWTPFIDHLSTASDRLCLHGIPMACYWLALQSAPLDEWLADRITVLVRANKGTQNEF